MTLKVLSCRLVPGPEILHLPGNAATGQQKAWERFGEVEASTPS